MIIFIIVMIITISIIISIMLQLPLLCLHLLIQPQVQHHRLLPALPALQVLVCICLGFNKDYPAFGELSTKVILLS